MAAAIATFVTLTQNIGQIVAIGNNLVTYWAGLSECYPYQAQDDGPTTSVPHRKCISGGPTYIKWIDVRHYDASDNRTGRWPSNLANRSLSLVSSDSLGTLTWAEQNLFKATSYQTVWQPLTPGAWSEIVRGSDGVVPGLRGTLLRRLDATSCTPGGTMPVYEAFIPTDLPEMLERAQALGHRIPMCFRKTSFPCTSTTPLQLPDNPAPFSECVGWLVRATPDHRPLFAW
jgi:hypothetical protein